MEVIKSFFSDYGYSFIMMVIMGAVIALTLEITVKSAFAWLGEKFKDNQKVLGNLTIAKTFTIQAYVWVCVIKFTLILMETMPLPGNKALLPVWLGMIYVLQYIFSYYGLKGLLNFSEKRLEKAEARAAAKAVEAANRPKLTPVEGIKGLYRNEAGAFVNAKGELV